MVRSSVFFKEISRHPEEFTRLLSGLRLRSYQRGVFEAVFKSILEECGYSFVVMFPRQSGKNELQAHLEVYLLTLFSNHVIDLIKVSPTQKPQAQTSMTRFERVARRNLLITSLWKKEKGNAYRVRNARITFLSGAPGSNIVGATASGLLEVDEAQQVNIAKFDRDIAPMSASTNATHVFWGTAWTSSSLLGREMRAAKVAETRDGVRRVFRLTADDISAEVEAYRRHVEDRIARMGRSHPMVRTQYFSEEVDGTGGMFPPERIARMKSDVRLDVDRVGDAPNERVGGARAPIGVMALLLDVAGEDEGMRSMTGEMSLANPSRDATALTLVEIEMVGAWEEQVKTINKKEMVGLPLQSSPEIEQLSKTNNTFDRSGRSSQREYELVGMERAGDAPNERVGDAPNERAGDAPAPTGLPTYRLVRRWQWIGVKHTELQVQIREIALEWKVRAVVVDATGVGAGLASFLDRALPGRVTPFIFSSASKSKLGWDFLAVVDSNRWQEPAFPDLPGDDQVRFQREFFDQLAACQFEVSNDSKRNMRWGVPDGSHHPVSGEAVHDDWVLSAALCAVLDKMDWGVPTSSFIVKARDPLEEMDGKY